MSEITKPNSPLKLGGGGLSIYPLTSHDQVILSDGSRWDGKGLTKENLLDFFHPVGSIYTSTQSINPSELFGGTWTQIKDTFLLTAGDTYTAGSTGGEAEVVLLQENMAEHAHERGTMNITGGFVAGSNYNVSTNTSNVIYGAFTCTNITGEDVNAGAGDYDATRTYTFNAANAWTGETSFEGGNEPHNNMPPYRVVYAWERTA